jgi:hypothetical protein
MLNSTSPRKTPKRTPASSSNSTHEPPSRKKIRKKFLRRASRQFCAGTPFKSPIQAVEAGLRTLEEWVDVLNETRDAQRAFLQAKKDSIASSERSTKRAIAV